MALSIQLSLLVLLCGAAKVDWKFWSKEHSLILDNILRQAKNDSDSFAVFDADNTIWKYDLEESLLPYLEYKNVITRNKIDPSLKLIPFKEEESLNAYYQRLCEIDDQVCSPSIAKVFSGHILIDLKKYVDELMLLTTPITTTVWENGLFKTMDVYPPKIYESQRELITRLQDNGVRVFVVSAAGEELCRMVASDPKYGLSIPPQRVIGVSLLLKDPKTQDVTTARRQIQLGHFLDDVYPEAEHVRRMLTTFMWSPQPLYVGKVAAIMDYIDPVKKPILVAGDSKSDQFMLLYSQGFRIWVNRKESYTKSTMEVIETRRLEENQVLKGSNAGQNWIIVNPDELRSQNLTSTAAAKELTMIKRRR